MLPECKWWFIYFHRKPWCFQWQVSALANADLEDGFWNMTVVIQWSVFALRTQKPIPSFFYHGKNGGRVITNLLFNLRWGLWGPNVCCYWSLPSGPVLWGAAPSLLSNASALLWPQDSVTNACELFQELFYCQIFKIKKSKQETFLKKSYKFQKQNVEGESSDRFFW